MKIAIISDLHIGKNGRFIDTTIPYNGCSQINGSLVCSFSDLVKEHKLHADFLLIPGDLTDSSTLEEFKKAKEVILAIAKQLSVPDSHIILCPGNHDKERKEDIIWDGEDQKVNFSFYDNMITGLDYSICGQFYDDYQIAKTKNRWSVDYIDGAVFISYNSTWSLQWKQKSTSLSPQTSGFFLPSDAHEILDEVAKYNDRTTYTIMTLHHHPILIDEPDWNPDFSTLVNAQSFLSMCADANVDIIIHGHKHLSRYYIENAASRRFITILTIGSFCKKLDAYLQGKALNQFCIVELSGHDSKTSAAMGTMFSWSYCPAFGWVESKNSYAGIDHINRFGSSATEYEIVKFLKADIRKRKNLGEKGSSLVDLISNNNRIHFAHKGCIDSALKTLKNERIIMPKKETDGENDDIDNIWVVFL